MIKDPDTRKILLGGIIAIFAGMLFWKFQKRDPERIQPMSAAALRDIAAKKHI